MEESAPLMGCSGPASPYHACLGAPEPAFAPNPALHPPIYEDGKMTFRALQTLVGFWQSYNFGPQPAYRQILGATEELGELAHAQLKMEQGIRGTPEEHKAAAKDAVGDVIIYLANYCTTNEFNLQQIIEDTWREISKRDWKKFPKNGLSE